MCEPTELPPLQMKQAQEDRNSITTVVDAPVKMHLDSPLHHSQLFTPAAISPVSSSPQTPVSIKGHSRLPSGSSAVASSPPIRASMDSYLSKRPLTQLKEDPEEKDIDMIDVVHLHTKSSGLDCFPDFDQDDGREPAIDYDWAENLPHDIPASGVSIAKRRRANKSTPSMISTKIAQRFPSISRRLRSLSEKRSSFMTESFQEHFTPRSRAGSLRSVRTKESTLENSDHRDAPLPPLPTPAASFIQEAQADESSETIDIPHRSEELPMDNAELPDSLARTPLLPPVLAIQTETSESLQSPLQSPKVAETPTSPPSLYDTPIFSGLPSPPLSAKPSTASFHHRSIMPPAEIPPMVLAETQDEWALKLGHANFTIMPQPYLPLEPTLESCKQLKADWEEAQREFTSHKVRTQRVYSSTSKIAQLTEEKWAVINGLWQRYHEQTLAAACSNAKEMQSEESLELSQASLHEPVPVTRLPDQLVGGKFPDVGDSGIVGPMKVARSPEQHRLPHQPATRGRKRGFWRFLSDLLPNSLVKSQV